MPAPTRDDFREPVRRALALRVGYRCSNPACQAPTSGPHTDTDRAIQLGVAAHISAAAPGGPRYDDTLTPAARAALSNGLWLCQLCARLIDTDEVRFPASLLQSWRREAETRALVALGHCSYVTGPPDLEALLLCDGDLPAGFRPAQVRDIPPAMFHGLPRWRLFLYRQIERREAVSGGVAIVIFHSLEDLDAGYEALSQGIRHEDEAVSTHCYVSRPLPIVGERALLGAGQVLIPGLRSYFGDVVFTRGGALVHVRLSNAPVDALVALARRIDARLTARPSFEVGT